jgi:hypothetical protein
MTKIDVHKIEYQLKVDTFIWEWDDPIEREL